MKYRVVEEISVDAENPLQAALMIRDIRQEADYAPVLVLYSNDYRVVHQVDLGQPADQAVTTITAPVLNLEPIEEREY